MHNNMKHIVSWVSLRQPSPPELSFQTSACKTRTLRLHTWKHLKPRNAVLFCLFADVKLRFLLFSQLGHVDLEFVSTNGEKNRDKKMAKSFQHAHFKPLFLRELSTLFVTQRPLPQSGWPFQLWQQHFFTDAETTPGWVIYVQCVFV